MRHAFVALCLGLAALLLSWGTQVIQARTTTVVAVDEVRPEQILPGDSVLMLNYDGQAAHLPALQETAAWKSLEESQLMTRVFELMETMVNVPAPGAGPLLRQAVDHVRSAGTSLGVSLGGDGPQPAPFGVMVFHDAGKLATNLEEMILSNLPPEAPQPEAVTRDGRVLHVVAMDEVGPGVELGWWNEGSHLVVAAGMDAVNQTLATIRGERPSLADSAQFRELRQSDSFAVMGAGWLNVRQVMDRFGAMPLPPTPSGGVMTIAELMEIPGLDAIDGMFLQLGFDGVTTWTQTEVRWQGEARGLLKLMDQQPLSISDLPPLPANVGGFTCFRFDAGAALETMIGVARDMVVKVEPAAAAQFDQGVGMAGVFIGVEPADLLNSFGDVWCAFSDTAALPLPVSISPAVAVSVRDRDVLTDGLTGIAQLAASFAAESGLKIQPTEKDGVSYWSLTVPQIPVVPTIMLTDEWLVAGITPVTAQTFAARLQGSLPKWEPSEAVSAGLQELPRNWSSLTFTDPKPAYSQMLQYAPMGMMLLQQSMSEEGVELPFGIQDLPIPEIVTAPMFPNLTVTVRTENGLTSLVRQSVPSTPLGDVSATAVVPILVALLLPAVQQAREAARRTQSKNNLKMIMLGSHNSHDAFRNFPAGTVQETDLPPDERLSWAYPLLPFLEEVGVYNQLDRTQAWDSDANTAGVTAELSVFQNPSQPGRRENPSSGDYVGVTGIGENSAELPARDRRAGIFGYNRSTRLRDVTDGTSNTLMYLDASTPNVSQLAGGRATLRGFSQKPYFNGPDGIGSPHPGVVQAALADGSVRAISVEVDDSILEAMATKSGGEIVPDF